MKPFQLIKGAIHAVRERFRSNHAQAEPGGVPTPSRTVETIQSQNEKVFDFQELLRIAAARNTVASQGLSRTTPTFNVPEPAIPPELNALLTGIVAEPLEETRWLVLADWLEENDDIRRGELLRLHRKLLATCCEPVAHLERYVWQTRIVELIAEGVKPCIPQKTLILPGGAPMTFSFIPPGSFLMGGTETEETLFAANETPIHKVTLTKGFFLGIHAVTQMQWQAVMATNPSIYQGPNRPVERVSRADFYVFCEKVNAALGGTGRLDLPTEAEWEYACRAGTTTHYHFGDRIDTSMANYDGGQSWNGSPIGKHRMGTTDVGTFPPNPWGVFEMHGNVWEWCRDWFAEYPADDQTDPLGPQGTPETAGAVQRGGSFDYGPKNCRSAHRVSGLHNATFVTYGFGGRVCLRIG